MPGWRTVKVLLPREQDWLESELVFSSVMDFQMRPAKCMEAFYFQAHGCLSCAELICTRYIYTR